MWRAVLLVSIAVLAGCSGLPTSPDTPAETVTPAPVPDVATGTPVEVQEATHGVTLDRLLARHEAALATRSFHRHVDGDGPNTTRDVWVDRDANISRVRQTLGPVTNDAIVVDGTTYRYTRGNSSTDSETRPTNGTVPYVSTLSGTGLLRQTLVGDHYHRIHTVERGGQSLKVFIATDSVLLSEGLIDRTVTVESRLYVDQDGIIRIVDHRARRPTGSTFVFKMTVTTELDRVPIPWWYDGPDPYVSGSM